MRHRNNIGAAVAIKSKFAEAPAMYAQMAGINPRERATTGRERPERSG